MSRLTPLQTAAALALALAPAAAQDIVLHDPANPVIHSTALDQPELYAAVADGGAVLTDGGTPVVLEAFVDTGASGLVISHLHNTDAYGLPSLHLEGMVPTGDFEGVFYETGVGPDLEPGDVTRPLELRVANIVPGMVGGVQVSDFESYGDFKLWVRQEAGPGEAVEIDAGGLGTLNLTDPINIVGMPVISQRVLVMDATPLAQNLRLDTKLLPAGSGDIPATQVAVDLELRSFVPDEAPPGQVLPSAASNPMIPGVRISAGGPAHAAGDWLFDTGASGTLVDFGHMQASGAIDAGYADFDAFLADYDGPTSTIGGIGGDAITVPILTLEEIRLPTTDGRDLVWQNVEVLVVDDVAGLDGVFGMNLLVPSVTLDLSALGGSDLGEQGSLEDLESLFGDYELLFGILAAFSDPSPGFFDSVVFDATDPNQPQLRFGGGYVPEPASLALLAVGGLAILRRRRRG